MSPPSRTRELLDLLEARWTLQGAPTYLAPGASERELDDAEHQLGFALPQEVRDWFGWHNGHDEESVEEDAFKFPTLLFPGNLQESIQDRSETLAGQDRRRGQPDESEAGWVFQPTWLSITQPNNSKLVADCAGAAQDRHTLAPIHEVSYWGGYGPWETPLMPSLTAMLEVWWQLTESGIWAFDPDGSGDWVIRAEDLPADLLDIGIFH